MGIQINGQTDIISAIDGGLTVSGADLGSASASSLNISGIVTATEFSGNVTGNVNATGLSTFSGGLLVGTGASISSPATNVLTLGTNNTEVVCIDSSGRVGIGTNTFASTNNTRLGISSSGEGWEFSTGWVEYNGGVIEYLNRSSQTTRPDLNLFVGGTSNGSIKFWTGGSEKVRVSAGGSVGVRTTGPIAPLHVNANSSPSIVFAPRFSSAHSLSVGAARTVFMYVDREPEALTWSDAANRDRFFYNSLYVRTPVRDSVNNPAIVIAENGGQASGRNSLVFWNDDLNSNSGYIKSRIYTQVGSNYNSTQFFIDVADSSRNIQNRFSIDVNGNFTGSASNDISDQRLKQNIQTITNPVDKIKALTGRTFEWQERASMAPGTKYGFIAQEVEEVVPELVLNESGIRVFDENDNLVEFPDLENGTTNYSKSVQSSGITPILVEALKEAIARIETLEAEVAELKSKVI
jgi:hypothetical protein